MSGDALSLGDIAAVLACSRATASRLRAGVYPATRSALPGQYAQLLALAERLRAQAAPLPLNRVDEAALAAELCRRCPREACAGCRVLEIDATPAAAGGGAQGVHGRAWPGVADTEELAHHAP